MSEFIMGVKEGLVAKAGSKSEVGYLAHQSVATPSPIAASLSPRQLPVALLWAAVPWEQPIAPHSPSALTCRTMQLQSNAFLLPTEAWDQVPPVSLTFHLQL